MADLVLDTVGDSPAAYLRTARAIEAGDGVGLTPLPLSFLSTATVDVLRPYLIVEGARNGYRVLPQFGAFNQLEQPVLDPASDLYRHHPSVIAVFTLLEDIAPAIFECFLSLDPAAIDATVVGIEERMHSLLVALRTRTDAAVVLFNYAPPADPAAGLADGMLARSQASVVQRCNEALASACRRSAGTFVFDYAHLASDLGLSRLVDARLWYMGRVPFGATGQLAVGGQFMRWVAALRKTPRKCLVVDLDNTLWGGVVGEDGPSGIALGDLHPGNVYKSFQRSLLRLRDRGILLAVASKNNERDALDVLERHPDCLLRPEHFAAMQISWQDKASSLRAIAQQLNIGTDALAFFDDNAVEREWVHSELPEVAVIDVPVNATGYARAVTASGLFDQVALSREDQLRAASYQLEPQREQFRSSAPSLEAFLSQLDLRATIGHADVDTLPRIAQLLAKTNQFNLTTRRHDQVDLQSMVASGAVVLWLRASDRFGDSGLVGVVIAVPSQEGVWTLDSLLMSCRVLGRGLERALVGIVAQIVRGRGARLLCGQYVPTSKNGQVADFYSQVGFEPVSGESGIWRLTIADGVPPVPEFIHVSVVNDGTLSKPSR